MITYSFIGSDKSAGKTTALNFIYRKMVAERRERVCVTSVGINGESVDFFDGSPKPRVTIYSGGLFLTSLENLVGLSEMFFSVATLAGPIFSKTYTLGRARGDFELLIEGPNTAGEVNLFKSTLSRLFPDVVLLIDGSADRLFLGRPEISDAFYFSLLVTDEPVQFRRAGEMLLPLSFPPLPSELGGIIRAYLSDGARSLLLSEGGDLIYRGRVIPFMDGALKSASLENRERVKYLYINGAFSNSLARFFEEFEDVVFILDNFTLFQFISVGGLKRGLPEIFLLNPLLVKEIFVKNDTGRRPLLSFPVGVPVTDLFNTSSIKEQRDG